MSTQKPLSISEVCNLQPGYVNDGFIAAVGLTEMKTGKAPKFIKFWVFPLSDPAGGLEVQGTQFVAPKFREGDTIEVTGQGIKFEDGQYGKKLSWGDKAQVIVLGQSAHHEEQQQSRAESAPAVNGQLFTVPGPTVGMAINNALDVLTKNLDTRDAIIERLCAPGFWRAVHETASDIIRVSRLLEAGKLAPSVKERTGGASAARPSPTQHVPQPPRPAPAAPRAAPTDDQLANKSDGPDEDVPF